MTMKCKKCGNTLSDIEFIGGVCSKCHSVIDIKSGKDAELDGSNGVMKSDLRTEEEFCLNSITSQIESIKSLKSKSHRKILNVWIILILIITLCFRNFAITVLSMPLTLILVFIIMRVSSFAIDRKFDTEHLYGKALMVEKKYMVSRGDWPSIKETYFGYFSLDVLRICMIFCSWVYPIIFIALDPSSDSVDKVFGIFFYTLFVGIFVGLLLGVLIDELRINVSSCKCALKRLDEDVMKEFYSGIKRYRKDSIAISIFAFFPFMAFFSPDRWDDKACWFFVSAVFSYSLAFGMIKSELKDRKMKYRNIEKYHR
jgi:hypothetical protein